MYEETISLLRSVIRVSAEPASLLERLQPSKLRLAGGIIKIIPLWIYQKPICFLATEQNVPLVGTRRRPCHCVNPGVVDEGCFPYVSADQACTLCKDWQTRLTTIRTFHLLPRRWLPSWIWSTSPVIACFHVYEDFFHYKSGVYTHTVGGFAGDHCIAIIGYEGGGWICKNSWGPGWGENGFCRIGFGRCGIDTWETYGIEL
jgi:hypothetical protein